ncbi:glycosylinositol phosphorylceramide mannosyl transferase 1 isoform X2 [Musa acuminata AAA Group]|uniref:glycosylinositol phosphorylceramide mannosyl transferase 1 isoform X2 n=1 Tax=Musa acuminata AAA Group TaxID=214697 RepID=UPI0031D1D4CB
MKGGGGGGFRLFFFSSGNSRRIPLRLRQLPAGSSFKIKLLLFWRGYTIVMNTWKRNDLLKQSVVHYASCVGVESIRIVWSEPDRPSDSLRDALWKAAKPNCKSCNGFELKFDINEEDSLNNRFKEIMDIKTDAIFSIDDDVLFPCTSVELAFSVWQSAPTAMVGFVPRMHWPDKMKENKERYRYGGWWSVWWTGTYSMVLSKAAFFHKKYLHLYTNHMPVSIRHYVTEHRNCEDIAMSFLVANVTGAPPIWVKVYCGRGDKKTAKGKRFKHSLGNARPRDKTRGRGPRLPRRTASTTERSSRSKSMSPSSPSPREPCSSLV